MAANDLMVGQDNNCPSVFHAQVFLTPALNHPVKKNCSIINSSARHLERQISPGIKSESVHLVPLLQQSNVKV